MRTIKQSEGGRGAGLWSIVVHYNYNGYTLGKGRGAFPVSSDRRSARARGAVPTTHPFHPNIFLNSPYLFAIIISFYSPCNLLCNGYRLPIIIAVRHSWTKWHNSRIIVFFFFSHCRKRVLRTV